MARDLQALNEPLGFTASALQTRSKRSLDFALHLLLVEFILTPLISSDGHPHSTNITWENKPSGSQEKCK